MRVYISGRFSSPDSKVREKIRELESQLRIAKTAEIIARWQNL